MLKKTDDQTTQHNSLFFEAKFFEIFLTKFLLPCRRFSRLFTTNINNLLKHTEHTDTDKKKRERRRRRREEEDERDKTTEEEKKMTVTGLIFSKKSREALHEANVSTASLSLIGCVFILLNVLVLAPSTRQSRAARLIYMLAVADFGYCVSVLSFDTTKLEELMSSSSSNTTTPLGCRAQGFFIQLFSMQTAMWSISMSHFTYSLVVKKQSGRETRDVKYYFVVIFLSSVALSVLPLFRNLYGDARIGKCHIKNDGTQLAVTARFMLFYLPIWVIMAANTYIWVKIFKTLRTLRTFLMESRMNANVVVEEVEEDDDDDNEDGDWAKVDVMEEEERDESSTSRAASKRAVKKAESLVYALAAYPIIQIITNIPGTFMRLENLFQYGKPDVNVYLAITHVILKNLQGFFHALVFIFVHPNKTEVAETLGACFYCFVGNSRRRARRWGGGIELAEEEGEGLNTNRELMPLEFERSDVAA